MSNNRRDERSACPEPFASLEGRLREGRTLLRTAALALLLAIGTSAPAGAQLGSYNPPAGPQGTFAIRNAKIFPVSGPEIANGTVVISGGKIQAVGTNVTVPPGAQVSPSVSGHFLVSSPPQVVDSIQATTLLTQVASAHARQANRPYRMP